MNEKYKVIAIMSGTSLDGVDISYCEYVRSNKWSFRLKHALTIPYNSKWKKNLGKIHNATAEEFSEMDCAYGVYLGKLVKDFCAREKLNPDFISSHGHTVFHQPRKGFTKQIGSGAHISAIAGYPVICDFRNTDVALGGQGAPLVPVGDKYLFPEMDYCLNLGGIANISFGERNNQYAFDICACNIVLNHYASKKGFAYDKNGKLASKGKINMSLLNMLNKVRYYSKSYPKSLGREDIERDIFPLIEKFKLMPVNVLATYCEHIAQQISRVIHPVKMNDKMMVTGGGAHNAFLVERIIYNCNLRIILPEKNIVDFKEAIIFGLLGVLRMRREINCLKTVTGATADCCGGAIYHT